MLKVIYTKDGILINDFKVYDFVDDYIKSRIDLIYNDDISIKISSELCLSVFILRVLENNIPLDKVEYYYEDEKLKFDPYIGLIVPNDIQMCFYAEVSDKILRILYTNLKKSREVKT